ncbi:transporter [Synergistales bacterium]|nr:transporter [Synergistales bacterium]
MKRTLKTFLIFAVILSIVEISFAAEVRTLDFGHALAENTPTGRCATRFAEVLAEKSGGAMKVNVYPSSQVGSEREMQEGCQLGTLDMSIGSTATLANFDKSWQIFDIPFAIQDYEEVYNSFHSEYARKRLDDLARLNIKGLGFMDGGFTEILNSKHVLKTPSDLKGMNIRCMEATGYITSLKAFGANPVQSATSEIYSMLQNGAVDGTCNPVATMFTFSLYENAKYLSVMHTWHTPAVIVMSMKTWNSLDTRQQQWVLEAAAIAENYSSEVRKEMEDGWIAKIKESGVTVTAYTPEERQIWIDYAKENLYPQLIPSVISQEEWNAYLASAKR